MATLASTTTSPSPPLRARRKSFARKCERFCCSTITYLPLAFVYGLTTWAVWVLVRIGFVADRRGQYGHAVSIVGICLYILLNWCYSTAVFTDPGSPLTQTTSAYSVVARDDDDPELNIHGPPMTGAPPHSGLTVKSSGETRYCKKCHTQKPDRTHHCSTCRRCVLKMDHHCPWLATCVGFKNYKPFILFLIYVSLFCWVCFFASASWVLAEVFKNVTIVDEAMTVHTILLAVLSGILGLVLTGFTSWHVYLAGHGQTTIESLEQTKYLSPLRKLRAAGGAYAAQQHLLDLNGNISVRGLKDQLKTIHTNALPGITRLEEGVEASQSGSPPYPNSSPAQDSLRRVFERDPYSAEGEAIRERERYSAYQDEIDSSKLPHAFDLGWRKNLRHLFGPRLVLAWLPVCNTTGDGWNWEPSREWVEAKRALDRDREARLREDQAFEQERRETMNIEYGKRRHASSREPREHGDDKLQPSQTNLAASAFQAHPRNLPPSESPLLGPPRGPGDGERSKSAATAPLSSSHVLTSNWNDLPEDMLAASSSGTVSGRSSKAATRRDRASPMPYATNHNL